MPLTKTLSVIECPVVLYRGSVLDNTDDSKVIPLQFAPDTTDRQALALIQLIIQGTDWQIFSWAKPSDSPNDEF